MYPGVHEPYTILTPIEFSRVIRRIGISIVEPIFRLLIKSSLLLILSNQLCEPFIRKDTQMLIFPNKCVKK